MKHSLLIILIFFTSTVLWGQTNENTISIGKKYNIQSKILNENRVYKIYLPPSYDNSPLKKYIVAYVLDGDDSKFKEIAGIVQSMNAATQLKMQIPELIIVAVENTDRTRDFTPTHSLNYLDLENIAAFSTSGKASNFMKFLETELMPEINKSYRTYSRNMIIGHSLGGLLAINCLLEAPQLFSYYLLIDPSWFWDHNYIGKRAREVLQNENNLKARVYISLANNFKEDGRHYQWGQEFYNLLQANSSPGLSSKIQYFPDEKHLTVPLPSTYYGLRYIFEGLDIDINDIMKDPSVVTKTYESISQKLALDLKPDEAYMNTIGYVALYDRKIPDAAISIFEINAQNYPSSLNVWDSLAEAYMKKGFKEKAKECYRKILALDPANVRAKDQLKNVK
ncbi:tetratricopeptide repeat protein [Chryseobacterium sp. Tr-659]|uniref:alpha/beta hydrolase-fold protein n=1 Tax=Chryseobacterium sp. Tr-659 TaxID=2608340 RepID=UPI00141D9CB3|nr:alpha/beta hydrolase-fold protein [Chryseobacterium sp. Tr-659]NIF06346.1 tetratricopeptide repeat protein [Chryseobacterium sp. Tr-659]